MSDVVQRPASGDAHDLRFHRSLQDQSLGKVLRLLEVLGFVEKDIVRTAKKLNATAMAGRQKQEALRAAHARTTYGAALYGSFQAESLQLSAAVERFSNDVLDLGERLIHFFDRKIRPRHFILREHDQPDKYVVYLPAVERDALPDSISTLRNHQVLRDLFTSVKASDEALETAAADYELAQADLHRNIAPGNGVGAMLARQSESWGVTLSLTDLNAGRFPANPDAVRDMPDHVLHSAVQPHVPRTADELWVEIGDRLIVIEQLETGWFYGFNLTAEAERPEQQSLGFFPRSTMDGFNSTVPTPDSTPTSAFKLTTAAQQVRKSGCRPLHPAPGLVDSTTRYLKFRQLVQSFTFLALSQFTRTMSDNIQTAQGTLSTLSQIALDFEQAKSDEEQLAKDFKMLRSRRAQLAIRRDACLTKLASEILPLVILSRGP